MVGRSLFVSTVAHPEMRRLLSQMKKPLLNSPLVLSVEGVCPLLMSTFLFSTLSSTRIVILEAIDVDKTAATPVFEAISHSVRALATSKSSVMNRYAVKSIDGRIDFMCSACESNTMAIEARRLRIAAATKNRVLYALVEATTASMAI